MTRATPPSRLFGANGLRTGADGRIYVAQCVGSQISALDVDSGEIEVISRLGGDIIAPDDLVFDERGTLYATEVMDARVSQRGADGQCRVLRGDLPSANGITMHRGRLFIDECRPCGRLLELDLNGGEPRVILDNLPMPNALAAGSDGRLYFPLMGANQIWRVDPEGGPPECVAAGLDHPVAVKFDSAGHIVSPQSGSGEVLRIDPRSGARTLLARLGPGLDNIDYVGDRLFVSHMLDGRITEVTPGGGLREVIAGGFQFPLDITIDKRGAIVFADNCVLYALRPGDGPPVALGRMFSPGFPGTIRGVAAAGDGAFVATTTDGRVVLYDPAAERHAVLAEDLDQPYAVDIVSGTAVVAEYGRGRVLAVSPSGIYELARGLDRPIGVAAGSDGACYVSEAGSGRVVRISGASAETVLDGLQLPHGVATVGETLYVVDAKAKTLTGYNVASGALEIVAEGLPVGAPPGIVPKPLRGFPPFSGPLGSFAGLAATADGTLYLSADAEGSVIALSRPTDSGEVV